MTRHYFVSTDADSATVAEIAEETTFTTAWKHRVTGKIVTTQPFVDDFDLRPDGDWKMALLIEGDDVLAIVTQYTETTPEVEP